MDSHHAKRLVEVFKVGVPSADLRNAAIADRCTKRNIASLSGAMFTRSSSAPAKLSDARNLPDALVSVADENPAMMPPAVALRVIDDRGSAVDGCADAVVAIVMMMVTVTAEGRN